MTAQTKRIIIGISGASGIQYGVKCLELLRDTDYETHLVMSKSAEQVRTSESQLTSKDIRQLADVEYSYQDIGAAISSGSYITQGMIIAPCSMRSLGEIASGMSSNLLSRAAEVVLKERRRLVLLARETPLTQIHLENMLKVTAMGGIIAPPCPAFYSNPKTLDDLVTHTVCRVLDLFDVHLDDIQRWA